MEFNLTKDYLGLSDVIFVNEEDGASEVCDMSEQTMKGQGGSPAPVWRRQDDTPTVKRALFPMPNMARDHHVPRSPRHELSSLEPSATPRRIGQKQRKIEEQHVFQQRPFSPRDQYETQHVFHQRPFSPRERYETQHVFHQRPFSPRDQYETSNNFQRRPSSPATRVETPRERCAFQYVPFRPRERCLSPDMFQQRPGSPRDRYQPPNVFQLRAFNPHEQGSSTCMSVTGCTNYLKPYTWDVSQAERTRQTSSKQQSEIGRTGQVPWCGMSGGRQQTDKYPKDYGTVLQHSEEHIGRSGTRQQERCNRGAFPERLRYEITTTPQNFVSDGDGDNSVGLRPFSVQMSDVTSRYPASSFPVDVTGSQDQTTFGVLPLELHDTKVVESASSQRRSSENKKGKCTKGVPGSATGNAKQVCKFCKTNGETKVFYMSHDLKDAKGLVTCPVLRTFRCPICKATGDHAHTVTYCPFGSGRCSVMVTSRTPRMSCGRPRLFDQ